MTTCKLTFLNNDSNFRNATTFSLNMERTKLACVMIIKSNDKNWKNSGFRKKKEEVGF